MPENNPLASQIKIKVKGQDLQPEAVSKILSVAVDQNTHLPGMFTIRLRDTGLKLLNDNVFDLADPVEISAQNNDGEMVVLIKGEVVGLEPDYFEGMVSELVVRGFDKSHRLLRQHNSAAYVNVKDSDIAQQIAGRIGLQSEIDTTQIVYEHVFQNNQTDMEFLSQRARRIGYECFVSEEKLHFRKPDADGSAAVNLTWGSDLLSFKPRMTLGEQVDEVIVKGWDVDKKEAIVGRASSGNLAPKFSQEQNGSQLAKQGFGDGKVVIVNQHIVSQEDAINLAEAHMNEISGRFVEAEGVATRRPDITAGKKIEIQALADRFNGSYLVTSALHLYTPAGFKTMFRVSGMRAGLIVEQINPAQQMNRISGLLPAIVTNTADPLRMGRVKLKFPTYTDDHESNWARVMVLGSGDQTGLCIIPEVGDEVLAAFVDGHFDYPIVLGGVYNGTTQLPKEVDQASDEDLPKVRTWHSASGHWMAMYDNDKKKIEIVSANNQSITLDDQASKIIIKTENVTLTIEGSKMNIESAADITIKAGSNLKLEAQGNLDLKANGQVTVKGAVINLN